VLDRFRMTRMPGQGCLLQTFLGNEVAHGPTAVRAVAAS
jgi:hypothetical protein